MGVRYNNSVVTNGLVGYWDFGNQRSYPGSGSNWSDLSGLGNAGTIFNSPTYSNANGGHFIFNGTNQYITIPDITGVTDFTSTDSYTVEFWCYVNSTQFDFTNPNNDIVEKWDGNGGYPYVFRYNRTSQKLAVAIWNGSTSNGLDLQFEPNRWWHICGVFDRANGLLSVYGNGGESFATTAYNITGTTSNSSAVNIMRRGNATDYAAGRMGLLKIYNRALTKSEVLQNYNATKRRFFSDSQPQTYYIPTNLFSPVLNLDTSNPASYSGSGSTWNDVSEFGGSATLIGSPVFTGSGPKYFSFTGSHQANFNITPTLGNAVTVEIWAKLNDINGGMIFGWNIYALWTNAGRIAYNTGSGDQYGMSSTDVTNLGILRNWKQFVFVMRSDVSYTNNKIYINAAQQSLSQLQNSENATNRNFNNGAGALGSWRADNNYRMNGDYSVLKIYNGELTQNQITATFNNNRSRFGI